MKETLYDRISYLAASNGMTIEEVERKAYLSNGSIRRWENFIPSADKLYRVSKILGTTMRDLIGDLVRTSTQRRKAMLNNSDKYSGKEKFYLIEYNNGEFDDAECIETLYVIFRSLENAREYIRRIPFKVDPRDYEEEVRDKLPSYRYYTYEIPQHNGDIEFYLEEDKFEEFLKCDYEKDSYYRIFEAWLLD